jgi:hypothetical protein
MPAFDQYQVMRGLDPRIHLPKESSFDGLPGPGYAKASPDTLL